MMGFMALVMGFSALLNVVVQFLVAQRRFKLLWPVLMSSVVYLGLASGVHSAGWQIVAVAGGCNALALLVTLAISLKRL
jgi:hypothetical protein